MSTGTEVLGEVDPVPVLAPSQAAIDLDIAQAEFDEALKNWSQYTPREFGERAERWWHCRNALRDAIAGEDEYISDQQEARIDAGDGLDG